MFCKNCGSEMPDNAITCQNCGTQLKYADSGSFGWLCLGCCIPIAGLVLYFVWRDQKPKNAKKSLIGFLISMLGYAIFYIFYIFIFVIWAMAS